MTLSLTARRILAALILLALIGLNVHRAHAGDMELGWTYPTSNVDTTAIPATGPGSIASSRVEWGSCSGSAFGTKAGEATVAAPGKTYTVTNLAPGAWCARILLSNTYGVWSDPTNVVTKSIAPPKPNPGVLSVINATAYEVLPHPVEGTRLGRNVGTVPLGTACGVDPVVQSFGGTYYEVPREAVALTKAPKSAAIVARCEARG